MHLVLHARTGLQFLHHHLGIAETRVNLPQQHLWMAPTDTHIHKTHTDTQGKDSTNRQTGVNRGKMGNTHKHNYGQSDTDRQTQINTDEKKMDTREGRKEMEDRYST